MGTGYFFTLTTFTYKANYTSFQAIRAKKSFLGFIVKLETVSIFYFLGGKKFSPLTILLPV